MPTGGVVPTKNNMVVALIPQRRFCAVAPFLKFYATSFSTTAATSTASFSVIADAGAPIWESGGVSMVQGASRGIGLEFVKQLLERKEKGHVIATCRNPAQSSGLLDLQNRFSERLSIMKLDVTVESSIKEAADSIGERYGYLNLLINASGILSIPNILQPETTLNKVQKSSLMLAYEVNAGGPILVIKHMWPLLKVGGCSSS
ncbi:hypothetical protein Dimus_030874 [Dionaea muscipula]